MPDTTHEFHGGAPQRAALRRGRALSLTAALAVSAAVALGACYPEVQKEMIVDSSAAGGTQNRDNTTTGLYRKIAPPGQGSALSDTASGRPAPAGVSGPTEALSRAAPEPRNAGTVTRQPVNRADTAGRVVPYAPSTRIPGTKPPLQP